MSQVSASGGSRGQGRRAHQERRRAGARRSAFLAAAATAAVAMATAPAHTASAATRTYTGNTGLWSTPGNIGSVTFSYAPTVLLTGLFPIWWLSPRLRRLWTMLSALSLPGQLQRFMSRALRGELDVKVAKLDDHAR